MGNIVITIGRECGSGGKYIGTMVAKKLGINFYDKELIQKTYERNGYNYSKLEQYDETKRNKLLKAISLISSYGTEDSFEDDTCQLLISDTIKHLADTESCVILGRSSNTILKNKPNVINIFIYSKNMDFKIKRKMKLENLSENEAIKKIKKIDKERKKYYEYVNPNHNWADKKDYDIFLDTGTFGVEKTIDIITNIFTMYNK